MGVKDIGTPARTLGRNTPIFTRVMTIEPAQNEGLIVVPVRRSEFTQAFEISITCRGNLDGGGDLAAFLFLVNSSNIAQAITAESLLAGQNYTQIIPGWQTDVTVRGLGVDISDYATRRSVTIALAVYQLDRVTRIENLGSA